MSENKQHPYAEILRAIADGEQIQTKLEGEWIDRSYPMALQDISLNRVDQGSIRIKPKTIRIGEYDVPEPLRVAPEIRATYYVPSFYNHTNFSEYHWVNDGNDRSWLKNGMCHSTKAAAQLHSKALISLTAQK